MMEIHQLRYFEATARLGSMMAAAAECHVSQPALSVQIRKLEEEAGALLLHREARGVRLTAAGNRTLLMARRVLNESRGWTGDMRSGRYEAGDAPALVAVQPLFATELLPWPLAELLRAESGRARLCFRERAAPVIAALLRDGDVDSALVDVNEQAIAGVVSELVLRVPYALFAPAGHPLARGDEPVPLAALAGSTVLLYGSAPGLAARLRERCRASGVSPVPAFSGEHAAGLFELVAAGAGVAVLPEFFVRRSAACAVAMRRLADYDAGVDVAWVRRQDAAPCAAMGELVRLIRLRHPEWAANPPGAFQ